MIHPDDLTRTIQSVYPDAKVTVTDRTGTLDHLRILVVSDAFDGQNLLNRQRMVYKALAEPMADGRIHALEISTSTHAEAAG
jgi:stress-induced morphogen